MEKGLNPYTPPVDGPVSPHYANMSPTNLALFAATLSLWDSPVALRVLFALVDGLIILTIGYLVQRPLPWRRALMWFYALNPLVLMSLVVMSEDKVVVIWMTILLVVAIEADKPGASLLLTSVITLYRWLGAFFIAPVALYFARTWRAFALSLALFAAVFALSHIPYWPENLYVYASRASRTLFNPPIHSSPTILLARVGLYSPQIVPLTIFGSLAALYALFLRRSITLVEMVILSIFLTNISAPELPYSRILMIALPLLWLVQLTRRRVAILWLATLVAAPFVHADLATAWVQAWAPLLEPMVSLLLRQIPNMLLMNLLAVLLVLYYLHDKRAGLVSTDTLLDKDSFILHWLDRLPPWRWLQSPVSERP